MAEFKLDRFKYIWRGDWSSGTVYNRDDIIRVKGKSYVCLVGHTASANFRTDLDYIIPGSTPPQPDPRWRVMTSSRSFVGNWNTSTAYDLGDIVFHQGVLYECSANHTSDIFSEDIANWTPVGEHIEFLGNWSGTTDYAPGALVKYNGIIYKCVNAHTSGISLELNQDDWALFFDGTEYRGTFSGGTTYRKGDLVRSGGTLWKCTETYTAGPNDIDTDNFEVILPGFQFDGNWDSQAYYQRGDVVIYNGNAYYALNNNTGNKPFKTKGSRNWILLAESYNFRGDYSTNDAYRPGDIVQRGGDVYIAISDVEQGDGSTNDFLDTTIWQLFKPGVKWTNVWEQDIQYYPGDLVIFKGSNYKCIEQHISTDNNFPGDNGSGFFYWEVFIQAGLPAGLEASGDLLTFGLSRSLQGDGSTKGPANLPIGETEEFLSVNEDIDLYYRNWISDSDVVYVAHHGSDEPGYGLSAEKPFSTVQYAAEYVFHNYEPLTPVKIKVSTGRFYETLPITIPAGCVVMGDELRSTTIEAAPADPDYANDWEATANYLTRFAELMPEFLTLDPNLVPTEGNNETLLTDFQPSTESVATTVQGIINDVESYVEYYVLGEGDEPSKTGNSLENTSEDIVNAINIIRQNREWLKAELLAYRSITDGTDFNEVKLRRDISVWIDSLIWDLRFTSNFKSLRAAEVYVNRVLGSTEGVDMFYVRDTTGLRSCTVDGLTGTFDDLNTFRLFARPTGGAYCSLDPGWGTDDENVWISNRSPYIQGVTTLGNNAIGKKVDGALHNGGNKSMTSNDFTQVISDGIGAWVLNGGRAELVSVFTYYAQIGYLAEDGGIIRATNGNNSYGTFGSVADGIDPLETPATAEVFNRNNEAVVRSAFAGEFQDEIFAFEYAHCGEEYTNATATVTGAGANVDVVYDEFTDGSISQVRLLNEGSGLAGGSGYSVYGNNAQTGDTTTITLAQSDDATADQYINMRLVITSGDGTGQYGIVNSFNPSTKVASIVKESTGQPGWDHIIPGKPIEVALSNNAVYRIEPRITCSDPGFSTVTNSLPNSRTFKDMTHGDTTETFTGVVVDLGNGEIAGDVIPSQAEFTVVRNGSDYQVTITDGGAGYAVGDSLTVLGTELGGTVPDNNLTITVTATTDDSTNAITGVRVDGTGLSGIFVAVALPNFINYSTDGINFTETFVSEIANWTKIVNGNGRFVMIGDDTRKVGVSLNGIEWNFYNLPAGETYTDITFGGGRFVVVAENSNTVLTSANGETWTQRTIPDDTLGDSTASQWLKVGYGAGRYLAIAGNDQAVAWSDNSSNWNRIDTALPAGDFEWISLTYGKNRWLAVDVNGATAYSIDNGLTWTQGPDMPSQDGSTSMVWVDVKYNNGMWFGICNTGGKIMGADPTFFDTSYCVTSGDGYNWIDREFFFEQSYTALAYASVSDVPTWVVLSDNIELHGVTNVRTGARAIIRASVTGSQISEMKIWDPGSGYVEDDNDPELTIFDNTFTSEVLYNIRLGHGVLGQPSFRNRGIGYRTSSTRVAITGDGFADIIPEDNSVVVRGVSVLPGPGAQLRFASIEDLETEAEGDLKIYTVSTITDLGDDGLNAGTRLVRFQITPKLEIEDSLQTGTEVEIRQRYSQCRISGHDFLDIGTGNFEETNYPDIYSLGQFFVYAPEYEVFERNGGRVFYTSTDQSGNFRAGELFAVEQATGIVTISAEFFSLDGLSELALGGVRLGGSGTVIREFSTDVNFTEDSNNVVPTQRAIATFFANRLSQGGSEIATNNLQSGNVLIGTEENRIDVVEGELTIPVPVHFQAGDQYGIEGSILAQQMFLRNAFFEEDRA